MTTSTETKFINAVSELIVAFRSNCFGQEKNYLGTKKITDFIPYVDTKKKEYLDDLGSEVTISEEAIRTGIGTFLIDGDDYIFLTKKLKNCNANELKLIIENDLNSEADIYNSDKKNKLLDLRILLYCIDKLA